MKRSIFAVQDRDPDRSRSLPQLYADVIAQVRHAEALGYDTFWVAEHHFHEYGRGGACCACRMRRSRASRTSVR